MTQASGNRRPHAAPELVAAVMSRDLSLVSWLVSAIPALSFSHIDPADPSLGDEARHVSVILLDYACLGDDGAADGSVLRRLRSLRPVLVLVPGRDRRRVATVLRAGADDAMCRPFLADELSARVVSLARRSARRPLGARGLSYDRVRRELLHADGSSRRLTPSESVILETLLDAAGRTVSRETLLRRMTQRPLDVKSNVVDRHIATLRTKLGDPHRAASCIATVSGSGYRLAGSEPSGGDDGAVLSTSAALPDSYRSGACG
jgi:two-component system OmpR family response regulator